MKKNTFLMLCMILLLMTACQGENAKSSEVTNSSSYTESSQFSTDDKTIVNIDDFTVVGYDFEPGDFKYQFTLTSEQQKELKITLQPEKWKQAEQDELPEYGLSCVLSAKSLDYFLYVMPWNESATIIKIVPVNAIGDGSDSAYYFAPFEVGEKSSHFIKDFK